jgi:hypothetical protein
MPSPELIMHELRATAPPAPDALRERVRALATERAPLAVPRRRFGGRRLALVLVPVCLAGILGAAIVGSRGGGGNARSVAAGGAAGAKPETATAAQRTARPKAVFQTAKKPAFGLSDPCPTCSVDSAASGVHGAAILPPARGRMQHYDVSLRLRVKDQDALSKATNDAMRLARGFGGFVAGVDYSSSEGSRGDALLTLRVPVGKIDQAIARFSKLGTIADQHVTIQDLQATVNAQNRQILDARKAIATLQEKLLGGNLTAAGRLELQARLAAQQRRLKALLGVRGGTVREGRLTTVSLAFTTAKRQAGGVQPPSRIGRAAHDAVALLSRVGAAAVYLAIVLSPLLVLGLSAFLTRRTLRRREETRLLAQA